MAILVFLGTLLITLPLGIPIAFVLVLAAITLMMSMGNFDATIVAQNLVMGSRLREKIRRQLPEWNLSVFAQRAGIVCAEQAEQYLQDTVEYVKTKRAYLREGLEALGIRVVSGEADFLLLYTTKPIYDRLLAKGILIRNCENFRGLGEGYYRIAVKKQEENEVLLRELAMGD